MNQQSEAWVELERPAWASVAILGPVRAGAGPSWQQPCETGPMWPAGLRTQAFRCACCQRRQSAARRPTAPPSAKTNRDSARTPREDVSTHPRIHGASKRRAATLASRPNHTRIRRTDWGTNEQSCPTAPGRNTRLRFVVLHSRARPARFRELVRGELCRTCQTLLIQRTGAPVSRNRG